MKFESTLTPTYKYQNHSGQLICSFLKACIVLNGMSKSILDRGSIELQTNWAIINCQMLSAGQLATGNHSNNPPPR